MPETAAPPLAGRGARPAVMGILNVTPDSFSDGGLYFSPDRAVARGLELAAQGADVLDIGGESTRPASYGPAETVAPEEEIRRVAPVVEALARRLAIPLSIDTRKGAVARAALAAGATIVNDVTALRFDPELGAAAARAGAAVVLMHMRGTDPRRMQEDTVYHDLLEEIRAFLADAVVRAAEHGIDPARIAIDPGLGFSKTFAQNLEILARLAPLGESGFPVLIGASRKGFVRHFSGIPDGAPAGDRLPGSLACVEAAARSGASGVRVHDVAETVRYLDARGEGASPEEAAGRAGAPLAPFRRMLEAIGGAS